MVGVIRNVVKLQDLGAPSHQSADAGILRLWAWNDIRLALPRTADLPNSWNRFGHTIVPRVTSA